MPINSSARYCPFCGEPAPAVWVHCAACGKQLPERDLARISAASSGTANPSRDGKWSKAIDLVRDGELDQASGCLAGLIESFPQDAEAMALMGSIYLRKYQVDKAALLLENAVAASPGSIFVRVKTAEYWLALGVPARALEELARAETLAEGDHALRRELKLYSLKVKASQAGKITHQAPSMPGFGLPGFLKKKPAPECELRPRVR